MAEAGGTGSGTGPIKVENATTVTGLLEVGPGANPPAPPDLAQGKAAGVWGYVGLAGAAPTQTSQPPIGCAVFGEVGSFFNSALNQDQYAGYAGVVGGCGYSGTMQDPDSRGDGVIGFGGGNGVRGFSAAGTGVAGTSTTGAGVTGTSTGGRGVQGTSSSAEGVYGSSTSNYGVVGMSTSGPGVFGQTQDGTAGVAGKSTGTGLAGLFDGSVQTNGNVTTNGNHTINGDITSVNTINVQTDVLLQNGDCAEQFDMHDARVPEPGTIVVIDDGGTLRESQCAYDRRVAGVVSGAGEYRPAIVLDRRASAEGRASVSLVGKVYCKVDADPAPIAVGDLLTTSARPGFAMKATDPARAFGAVVGKALKSLPVGQGMIPILVTLQ